MKLLKVCIILLLFINHIACFSQDIKMDKEVEKIVQLGKDSIIKLAIPLIDNRVDIKNFYKTKVVTNGKEIYVSFINPIKNVIVMVKPQTLCLANRVRDILTYFRYPKTCFVSHF